MAADVTQADFETAVIERSKEVPVVVDFWAAWCGPCRALGPLLEAAADKRTGKVDLVKIDTDANQELSRQFGIQGIPAVKAFRDGKVVSEFVGALPQPQVERFFDELVPSEADELAAGGDEHSLRKALQIDPRHTEAAIALARLLLERDDAAEAAQVVAPFETDFVAQGLATRAAILADDDAPADLQAAVEALNRGDDEQGLADLAAQLDGSDQETREQIRKLMVGSFAELGADHELAREYRRKLAAAIY